jgi:uncharacterized protein (DUF169 family)
MPEAMEAVKMSYEALSALLRDTLGLGRTPVALAFADEAPPGAGQVTSRVPSACAFWRMAEEGVFFASASDHAGCSVGAHVMGLPMSDETGAELMGTVTMMAEVGYLPSEEVAHIPTVQESAGGVVYGPLADFPVAPAAVLLWTTPAQAMLLEEGLKLTTWRGGGDDGAAAFGRPACGAVARAINSGQSAMSLGCAGMRTFTGIEEHLSLVVIPGASLQELGTELERVSESNAKMRDYYATRKAAFAAS